MWGGNLCPRSARVTWQEGERGARGGGAEKIPTVHVVRSWEGGKQQQGDP